MRKLIVSTYVSLDGVIDNPMWTGPYWNDALSDFQQKDLFASDVLLLGRETYEAFAEAWSSRDNADSFTARINAMPKYVASRTLKTATWNSTIIQGDVPTEIAKLKAQPGENILKYGGGELLTTLLQHNLVDELHLILFPVIVGEGARLVPDGGTGTLTLVENKPLGNDVVGLIYKQAPQP